MGLLSILTAELLALTSTQVLTLLAPSLLVPVAVRTFYRASFLHPLSTVPGPLFPRLSSAWLNYHAYIGDEATIVQGLHKAYGAVVRTGPSSVDIADGAALQTIYVDRGGFAKPDFYGNFDIDGHKSIFSEIEAKNRAPRAKAVMPIFSTASLRSGSEVIENCVDAFVCRFRREIEKVKATSKQDEAEATTTGLDKIDILSVCRALAIDVVTGYLFGRKYGACEEDINTQESVNDGIHQDGSQAKSDTMTASAMVDSFVAVGRFWYLPPRVFQWVEYCLAVLQPDRKVDQSIAQVDVFVAKVVGETEQSLTTATTTKPELSNDANYPLRMLQAKISASETRAQCKDLIFAGTDSTAMNLATIIFHLVQNSAILTKLRSEIAQYNSTKSSSSNSTMDIQSLPYLRGVIREGLRMSMANPSRLPRVVPEPGWSFDNTFLPPGTVVSCTPYSLHFNPSVYPDPFTFCPERWTTPEMTERDAKAPDLMTRDFIPFGLGSRQCIARNLATTELFVTIKRLIEVDSESDQNFLQQLKPDKDKIEIMEWFNSHVVGGRIDLVLK